MLDKLVKVLFVTILLVGFTSCAGDPDCITDAIEEFKLRESACSGASVIKYRFQGEIVYGFREGNCISDGGTSIIDEECNDVCFLGGFVGFTDCNDVDFFENAEELDVLYLIE